MSQPNIKIEKENIVYENQYGKLYDDDVVFLPQNTSGKYIRWKWNSPYSVAIVPILSNGDIVLIESFRHAARKAVIEIPKGFGANDISPLEMAKKELAEETGLKSENWKDLGEIIQDTAFAYHPMRLFIASQCNEENLYKSENSEVIIKKHFVPLSSIPKITSTLEINDSVSLIGLMLAYQEGI